MTAKEKDLLNWIESTLRERLAEEHIALEAYLVPVAEIQDKAVGMGMPEWDNWATAATRMAALGFDRRVRRIIRDWKRAKSANDEAQRRRDRDASSATET